MNKRFEEPKVTSYTRDELVVETTHTVPVVYG